MTRSKHPELVLQLGDCYYALEAHVARQLCVSIPRLLNLRGSCPSGKQPLKVGAIAMSGGHRYYHPRLVEELRERAVAVLARPELVKPSPKNALVYANSRRDTSEADAIADRCADAVGRCVGRKEGMTVASGKAAIERVAPQNRVTCTIGPVSIAGVLIQDGEAWLTAGQVEELFDASRQNAALHLKSVMVELRRVDNTQEKLACLRRQFPARASNGATYLTNHYSSLVVQHVGYHVRSERGTLYRQWVTGVVRGEISAPDTQDRVGEALVTMASIQQSLLARLDEDRATIDARHDMIARQVVTHGADITALRAALVAAEDRANDETRAYLRPIDKRGTRNTAEIAELRTRLVAIREEYRALSATVTELVAKTLTPAPVSPTKLTVVPPPVTIVEPYEPAPEGYHEAYDFIERFAVRGISWRGLAAALIRLAENGSPVECWPSRDGREEPRGKTRIVVRYWPYEHMIKAVESLRLTAHQAN